MIKALHLIWILPLSAFLGMLCTALAAVNKGEDIPPICEDCPRTRIADPIGEKYGTEEKK